MKLQRANKVLSLKADALQGNKMVGYASGLGNMDSYTDVIFPKAFSDETRLDFLSSGFIADCHDWTKVVGMPLVAEVRGNLVYTEFEFHSTPDAQVLKTKCSERIERDLAVGLSVGIGFYQSSTKTFPTGAALLAYAEEQGEDMSLFDVEGIKAHPGKCRGILNIDKWYEYSPITTATPANPNAWATGMKKGIPGTDVVTKGEFLGDWVLGDMTMGAISRATNALMYNVFYDAVYDYDNEPLDIRRARIAGGLGEYSGLVLRVFDAIMAEDAEESSTEDADVAEKSASVQDALTAIKALWTDPTLSTQGELPAGSPFEKQIETARAAVKGCTERARSLYELRAKEGRTISDARRAQLTAQRDEMNDCLESINQLLTDTDKSADTTTGEKSSAFSDADQSSETETPPLPAVDTAQLAALRMKQLKRKNEERETAPEGNA